MTIHADCATACRRGEDAIPCRVVGGCGVEWDPECVLCGRNLDHGHVCGPCGYRITRHLDAILQLTAEAAAHMDRPSKPGAGRSVPGSRPPLVVEALDPELTLVRLVPDDPSTEVPMLTILEDWERIIREDRGLVPYGIASEARLAATGPLHGASWARHTPVTLTGVVRFLQAHQDWVLTEPSFDVAEYARQIELCRRAVARWDADAHEPGWRVPCPTVGDDGDCGQVLKVARGAETVYCRACGREWDITRLLAVAGRDADVWVDLEAAATLAGIHERTLRRWISRGHVTKRGQLVRIQDVRQHADALGA
jgi:hypothetical protein